nr:reverse transcriptase domain-containing protein [Tanacetum cinerariifolium]
MRTRSQSRNNFPQQEASPAIVEPLRIALPFLEDQFQEDPPEDPPEVPMADNRTMAELLQPPTEGYEDAVVIPKIAANNFKLKHGLINLVQNKQFFGHDKEDPHAHIRYFNKITSTMRVPKVPRSGTLPSNTITNLKEELRVSLPEAVLPIKDLQFLLRPNASMPNLKPSIPYPSRRDNERRRDQANEQIEKFYEIFKDMSFEISFTDALTLMPKFASTIKALIGNKEKLSEMARTPMNEHYSPVILNKLPVIIAKELGDEEKSALIKGTNTIVSLMVSPGIFKFPIDPRDQEKTTFTYPYRMFAYRRMPFGLCNAPGTFQRCMLAIFHDMVEKTMEVVMDDFSVFGNSFENCLSCLDKMLQRCKDTNLCLNWEKSHFMVKEGIVLGHKISKNRIEVDKAKVDVIAILPHPTTVKGVRSFLGHVGFYRRFIQDFSKISRPMTHLLETNTPFIFSKYCIKAFHMLKKKLTEAPILIALNWDLPFELVCDASDFAIGAVLGQPHEKHFRPIHYASKTMTDAESNYTTTEKEMLAVVYAFEKFRSYLIMNKSIVHTDHSALKYLFAKKDAKTRLLRWVLLFQEFDFKVLDTKRAENLVADLPRGLPTLQITMRVTSLLRCKLLAVGSPFFWQWEHPPLAVGTYTASGNSLIAVGMPCAFYSQHTRSSFNLPVVSSNPSISNPKRHNRRRSKQPFILEESLVDTMADHRTMVELLRAPTEGYKEAIVGSLSVARKITPHSIHTWEDLVSKFINEFFPSSRTTNLRNEILNFQQRFDESFHKAWDRDNIQGYVLAVAVNYNQGNPGYCPPGMANQIRPPGFAQPNVQNNQNQFGPPQGFSRGNNFNPEHSYQAPAQQNQNVHLNELEKVKRMSKANMKAMQTQINMVKNELINEMKIFIQTSLSNQTNEASLLQMNTASTLGSGSLLSNTVANPKGELKAITTRSGIVLDGPTIPIPPQSINPEVEERVEYTFTDPNLAEYTIKVPPPPVQKYKPLSQREYVLHINITLADALILMPKYQKMLKDLLSNKEKLQELANTPLNENCSAVILKNLPKKLRDPGKFLIPCGFSELKCKALADLGDSINLMPLSVWKKLGLPELISTHMTLELANRAICTPAGIARDVFILVGKFTFLADFVIVDYESDPRVPLILGRPFLRTARALIDVHESINLINVFNNSSDDFLEDVFSNQPSGNPTFSSHPKLASPKVNDDIFDSEGRNVLSEKLLNLDSTKDLHPPLHDNQLSGSTTYSNPLLEEFADKLAFPPKYDDDL